MEALNQGLNETAVNTNNRWRKKDISNGVVSFQNMQMIYTVVRVVIVSFLCHSRVM